MPLGPHRGPEILGGKRSALRTLLKRIRSMPRDVVENPSDAPDNLPRPVDIARGHELRDVNVLSVVKFVVALGVGAAVIHVLLLWMMSASQRRNERQDRAAGREISPLMLQLRQREPPPQPALQPSYKHPTLPYQDTE